MANTDAEAQENERLNHLRIDNRRRESERFVETCAAELRRQQKYQLEVWPPRELAQRSLVTAQVAAAVADCQEVNAFEFGLLLKAEDLADLLVRLVKAGDIHTRTHWLTQSSRSITWAAPMTAPTAACVLASFSSRPPTFAFTATCITSTDFETRRTAAPYGVAVSAFNFDFNCY